MKDCKTCKFYNRCSLRSDNFVYGCKDYSSSPPVMWYKREKRSYQPIIKE